MTITTATPAAAGTTASIVKTLGSGSGIDTAALVSGLVSAQYAVKNKQLADKADTLTAQISGVAKLKNSVTTFDSALRSLVQGGTLSTQPTSSASAVLTVASTGTAALAGLNARVTVNRLAAAQAATTNTAVARTAAFREGRLDVTIGGATTAITIDGGDATLDGVAAKINAAGLGLSATVVGDGAGARLTIKGRTGAANAFTISGVDADPAATGASLSTFSVGAGATGTTIGVQATDAELVLDGATFTRATNTVADLIAGVRLELGGTGASTIGASAPTSAIGNAVSDFVSAYNELQGALTTALDPKTGDLKTDAVARDVQQRLGKLTTTSLAAATTVGAPRTLADLGVKTNRDGSLTVDTAQLSRTLARYPDAAEAMFAPGAGASGGGISAALSAIAARASDRSYGFDAETTRYTQAQTDTSAAQAAAAAAAAALSDRLTAQFATMDARVAAYKSTQDFLKQQVDAWYAQK